MPSGVREFAQGSLLVLIEAASLILAVTTVGIGEELSSVLRSNQFPPAIREALLLTFSLSLPLVLVGCAAFAYRYGAAALSRWGRIASPLIPLSLLPSLLCAEYWFSAPLEYLVTLGFVSLLAELTLRPFFESLVPLATSWWRPWKSHSAHRWMPVGIVVLASLAYTIVSAYLTILDHYRFGTGSYDLGIFDNMMFNTLHGRPFRSSIMYGPGGGNSIAGHAELAMVVFAPLYALWPRAEGMLVLQALALGGAALPLYAFARTRLGRWSSCFIASLYLLYTPIHGAQYYDFHWLTMATPFLFLLFYGFAVGSKKIVIPTALLLLALREDIPPGLAIVGLFLLLTGARPRWGAALALLSGAWFGVLKFVIMPYFGTWFFADLYKGLAVPGESGYGPVVKTLLTNPLFVLKHMFSEGKLTYMLHILVPLVFLPLRRPIFWLLLVPGVFFTVLTNWPAAYSLKYHYSTHFTPYVFATVVLYLSSLRREQVSDERVQVNRWGRFAAALGALAFALLCHSTVFGLILNPKSFVGGIQPVSYTMTNEEKQRLANLESMIEMIPPDASVTATDLNVPHLSNRSEIYAIGQSRFAGEYLLLEPHSFRLAQTKQNILALMERYPYGFVAQVGTFTLWKKGHSPEDPEQARSVKARLYKQIGGPARRGRPSPGRKP